MSKQLKDLEATGAGVSQAVLTKAFDELSPLTSELEEVEAEFATALAAKHEAQDVYEEVKAATQVVLRKRDAVREEWKVADWIVRNADPDQPAPPSGIRPPAIKTLRS